MAVKGKRREAAGSRETRATREARSSRKAREEALRQEIILEAAERVIAQKGYRGASMEEIARMAQLSAGSLYNAFASKEDLYRTLVNRRSEELVRHVQAHLRASTAVGRLENVIETLFAYFHENQNFFAIYIEATAGFQWHIEGTMGREVYGQYQAFVETVADRSRSPRRRLRGRPERLHHPLVLQRGPHPARRLHPLRQERPSPPRERGRLRIGLRKGLGGRGSRLGGRGSRRAIGCHLVAGRHVAIGVSPWVRLRRSVALPSKRARVDSREG
jgi:AcrR family transcriptional regulator